jgi:hypothetical protein
VGREGYLVLDQDFLSFLFLVRRASLDPVSLIPRALFQVPGCRISHSLLAPSNVDNFQRQRFGFRGEPTIGAFFFLNKKE